MMAFGSPSAIFLPKSITISRSTTASSAWTTCSIQMIVDAAGVDVLDGLDQRLTFRLGQTAGDLVQQQQLRFRAQRAGQFQPLAVQKRQAACPRVGLVQQLGLVQHVQAMRFGSWPRSPAPCVAAIIAFSNTVMPPKGCGT